jgi:hypothetical protein
MGNSPRVASEADHGNGAARRGDEGRPAEHRLIATYRRYWREEGALNRFSTIGYDCNGCGSAQGSAGDDRRSCAEQTA